MSAPNSDQEIKQALADVIAGRDLAADRMASLVGRFMDGEATAAQIGSLLTGLRMKGESVAEVVGAARAMRARMRTVTAPASALDTCGTGGDSSGSVNISTLAAFIAAGAGVTVAKHGNRALSSRSGSHDVIEALGLDAAPTPDLAERCLREAGLAFLFAPLYHAATKNVAVARRELGFRTLFNLLGPLTNPAAARHHLNGVFAADRVAFLAEAHRELGAERALVVHGEGQLDELSPRGATLVAELRDGRVRTYEVRPADFGLDEADPAGLKGGGPDDNARLLLATLRGEPGAIRTAALMTAGAGLFVAGRVADLREGAALAARSLDDGGALGVLETLRRLAPRPEATS